MATGFFLAAAGFLAIVFLATVFLTAGLLAAAGFVAEAILAVGFVACAASAGAFSKIPMTSVCFLSLAMSNAVSPLCDGEGGAEVEAAAPE